MKNTIVFAVSMVIMIMSVFYTRLVSILLWNNAAFAVLSLVMLGLSVSGLVVYLFPRLFSLERLESWIVWLLPIFALSILVSFAGMLHAPGVRAHSFTPSLWSMLPLVSWAIVPFFTGGLIVSLILAKGYLNISRLYFYDMCGAALGALLAVVLIYAFNGGALLFCLAAVLSAMGFIFALRVNFKASALFSITVLVAIVSMWTHNEFRGIFTITHARGRPVPPSLHTRWDPVGRITITPWLWLQIDNGVGTPVIRYDGNPANVGFLRNNILQLAYHLGPFGKTVIIGPGGGGDVLSALIFDNKNVTAVEINRSIVNMMQREMARISGDVYNRAEVSARIMDGRAYLAKLPGAVDLIQATFIDTYAAGAAGSQALSENYLYTTSAMHDYLDHLTPDGLVSISRWAGSKRGYSETFRVIALAERALRERGVETPGDHVVVVQGPADELPGPKQGYQAQGETAHMATILIGKAPFSEITKQRLRDVLATRQFRPLWFPGASANDATIAALFRAKGSAEFYRSYYAQAGFDISPITDDKPFFFQQIKPGDFFEFRKRFQSRPHRQKYIGAYYIWQALAALSLLVLLSIALPLAFRINDVRPLAHHLPILLYFIGIGLGYMGIELGLIHQFAVFLEHPIYSLVVVIATLLFSSAIGSFLTGRVKEPIFSAGTRISALLLGALCLAPLAVPFMVSQVIALPFLFKCAIAMVAIFPLGLLMGMMFPLGVKTLPDASAKLMPWLWGINTGFSVFAGVISMFIATNSGFSRAWMFFTAAYALSALSMLYMRKTGKPSGLALAIA